MKDILKENVSDEFYEYVKRVWDNKSDKTIAIRYFNKHWPEISKKAKLDDKKHIYQYDYRVLGYKYVDSHYTKIKTLLDTSWSGDNAIYVELGYVTGRTQKWPTILFLLQSYSDQRTVYITNGGFSD